MKKFCLILILVLVIRVLCGCSDSDTSYHDTIDTTLNYMTYWRVVSLR